MGCRLINNRLSISLLELDKPLPDWSLETIFGDNVPQVIDFKGKPLVILFFSLGCPGCLGRAIPYANRLVYENGDELNVIGIHTNFEGLDFTLDQFRRAKEDYYFRFPFYKDRNFDTTFLNYGAGGTPHWILIDSEGLVRYSIFGSDPNNALLRLDLKFEEMGLVKS